MNNSKWIAGQRARKYICVGARLLRRGPGGADSGRFPSRPLLPARTACVPEAPPPPRVVCNRPRLAGRSSSPSVPRVRERPAVRGKALAFARPLAALCDGGGVFGRPLPDGVAPLLL